MPMQPTLLSSCARAATAAEARFRIDAGPRTPRATRVVALDAGASRVVRPLAGWDWRSVRFLDYRGEAVDGQLADLPLWTGTGDRTQLSAELAEADFMLMVATAGDGATAAAAIGNACVLAGIMTAGVILGADGAASAAVSALRPYARVLLVSRDQDDVAELLSVVGA